MNNLKALLLLIFTVLCFSSTPNFASAQSDSHPAQTISYANGYIIVYEYHDGILYKVTYDEDGRIVDREATE